MNNWLLHYVSIFLAFRLTTQVGYVGPGYIGCYSDTPTGKEKDKLSIDFDIFVDCIFDFCLTEFADTTHFGLQRNGQFARCYCYDPSEFYNQIAESNCDNVCSTLQGFDPRCGQASQNIAIYEITAFYFPAPTPLPTRVPTSIPTAFPTAIPTPALSSAPTLDPTGAPTAIPTVPPTRSPSAIPSASPSAIPTMYPSALPSAQPTASPTVLPTPAQTTAPSTSPTAGPTGPTAVPTVGPTVAPTVPPTVRPTANPSAPPTKKPSAPPSASPTAIPSASPTRIPTAPPSAPPTAIPSAPPTGTPTAPPTAIPTPAPTLVPTAVPSPAPSPGWNYEVLENGGNGANWTEARAVCTGLDGDLISIHNTIENFEAHTACKSATVPRDCWIGLASADGQDPSDENTYEWSDMTAKNFDKWELNEPHNNDTTVAICTHITSVEDSGVWYSSFCDVPKNFICRFISPIPSVTLAPTAIPSPVQTLAPTPSPTLSPIPLPTLHPIPSPTLSPTPTPTRSPVPIPTPLPIPVPTVVPSPVLTPPPVPAPSEYPIPVPTLVPVPIPTSIPTSEVTSPVSPKSYEMEIFGCFPVVSDWFGGTRMKCNGSNFHPDLDLFVDHVLMKILDSDFGEDELWIEFETEAYDFVGDEQVLLSREIEMMQRLPRFNPDGGEVPVEVMNPDSNSALYSIIYASQLASEQGCVNEGFWWNGAKCVKCAEDCCFCPGGDRIYPREGYWSPDQHTEPFRCSNVRACPGALGTVPGFEYLAHYPGTDEVITNLCNHRLGYTGSLCAECLDEFYQDQIVCRKCGLEEDERAELIGLFFVAVAFLLFIAFCIMVLNDLWLGAVVSVLIALQQFFFVARQSAPGLDKKTASILNALNFVNFEVEFVKSGCEIPKVAFTDIFWITIIIILISATFFVAAAWIRHRALVRGWCGLDRNRLIFQGSTFGSHLGEAATLRQFVEKGFKWRSIHGLLILANIVYLQISIRCFQGINCIDTPTGLRLKDHQQIQCYVGEHLGVAMLIWILIFTFVFGFPCWCFYVLYRAHKKGLHDEKRSAKYGFLYRDLKMQFYYFRLTTFPLNLFIALQATLASDISVKIFTSALFFLISVTFVGVYLPYEYWYLNLAQFGAGIATVIQILILLNIISNPLENDENSSNSNGLYTGVVATFLGTSLLLVLCARIYAKRHDKSKARMLEENRASESRNIRMRPVSETEDQRSSTIVNSPPSPASKPPSTIELITSGK